MQQQTGHYAGGNPYPSPTGPSSDGPYPYTNMAGSAPPYTSAPPYYGESSYQIAAQPPQYIPPLPSLADSMGSLNISTQGSHLPASSTPSSYAPSMPFYDQSYTAVAPTNQQGPLHPPSYTSAGLTGDISTSVPPAGYYPSAGSLMGSYLSKEHTSYDIPSAFGSYGSSSSELASYGVSQHGVPSYEHPGGSLGPSQTGILDRDTGVYGGAQHGREFERPVYVQTPSYDSSCYEKPISHDSGPYNIDDVGLGEVYAYDGGNAEPYGARGTGTGGSWGSIDSLSSSLSDKYSSYGNSGSHKLPKAVPKVEPENKSNGVQKYRVKMRSDGSSGLQDVLCQIGLDGIRMILPSTGKTVQIYPLETVTRWEVTEPSVFTFWSKSAVDIEPRRIRLQSGHYTTNAILDTLTAACVQFSEMVGKDGSLDSSKSSNDADKNLDQEKKRVNFANWAILKNRQGAPEEKEHWVPDEAVTKCSTCSSDFGAFLRRHHCRNCGDVFCDKCSQGRTPLTADEDAPVVRVCDRCLAEVTQRLNNAKDINKKPPPAPRSHDDLAKKLQEMEQNLSRKLTMSTSNSSGKERSGGQTTVLNCSACGSISLVSDGTLRCPTCGVVNRSGNLSTKEASPSSWPNSVNKRMREVACPTCTVHLQVQVPNSGTETVECGVCQHPFLVSAH